MKNKILAVDFDATLSTYIRPWKYNALGNPIQSVIDTIRYFYNKGCYIMIFTGRLETPELAEWLNKNRVPYHSINKQPSHHELASRFKPYYHVILDDKAVNPMFAVDGKYKPMGRLITEINEVFNLYDNDTEDNNEK